MQPVERIPVCNQVVRGIQEIIQGRQLKPGDKLPTERELCESFGVGRSTVREAIRTLQALGVLTLIQGRGAFVGSKTTASTDLTPWFSNMEINMRDLIEIRLAVEPLSVRLAIERASEEEIAEIAKIHSLFIQTVPKDDPVLLANYDEAFHMEIARATHNKLMVKLQEAIRREVYEMRIRSFSVATRMSGAVEPHERILHAFYKRDIHDGMEAMTQHLTEAFAEVLDNEA